AAAPRPREPEERRDRVVGQDQHYVPAEPDERLLADRHQPGVARQEVPHARHGHQHEHVDEEVRRPGQHEVGQVAEDDHDHQRAQGGPKRGPPGPGYLGRLRPAARRGVHRRLPGRGPARGGHAVLRRAVRPCGLTTRMSRNTSLPARTWLDGPIWAPICWTTPSNIPPTSVPHGEPRPPMTTASKANSSSWSVPIVGSNEEYMPNASPASATLPNAIAPAMPNTCR